MSDFINGLSAVTRLALGYLLLILLGWALLCLPAFQAGEATTSDHLFTAASALTTTGLSTVPIGSAYAFAGQLVTLVLLQIGGIGYMSVIGLFLIGRHYRGGEEEDMVQQDYELPDRTGYYGFLLNIIRFTVAAELLGAVALYFAFRSAEVDLPAWNAIYVSVSAFCTAGLQLFDNGLTDFRSNWSINLIVSLLSLCGAFGFLFFTDLRDRVLGRSSRLKFTSQLMLRYLLVAITATIAVFFFLEPTVSSLTGTERFYAAVFQAVSVISTTGFYTVDLGGFVSGSLVLTLFLMYVGGSPSGTGGGIKNTVFLTTLKAAWDRIRQREDVYIMGKRLPKQRVIEADTVALSSLGLLMGLMTILAYLQPGDFAAVAFEATSAIGTVGLSRGLTSELGLAGKLLICLLMFAGRIGTVSLVRAIFNVDTGEETTV